MPKHAHVLVPLETWAFHSPKEYIRGIRVDIGLLAEALIYYDQVFAIIQHPSQLDALIEWFAKAHQLPDLLSLLRDKVLQFYHHAFWSTAIAKDGVYSIWNVQDEGQADDPATFISRVLYRSTYEDHFIHARKKAQFIKLVEDNYIEVKAEGFEPAVQNAKADYLESNRDIAVMQALIDEIYDLIEIKKDFEVAKSISIQKGIRRVEWNFNFNDLNKHVGISLLDSAKPLVALASCNRLLWSSAILESDLYLGSPMSSLAGDKLLETAARTGNIENLIDQLIAEVEFPNIRDLVNSGDLGPAEVLTIRNKATRFRTWLQEEAEKDRNSIIAYHQEVAKDSGLANAGRKVLSILGPTGGALAGAAVTHSLDLPEGSIWAPGIGAAVGSRLQFLFDLASTFGTGWKPAVFGQWSIERINRYLKKPKKK